MNFMDALVEEFYENHNTSRTENGAAGYRTTRNPILDMNFKVATYRKMDEDTISQDFIEALAFDEEAAIAWMFFVRDIRGGLGERRLFRILFETLCRTHPESARKVLSLISEYGRYDDLIELYFVDDNPLLTEILRLIKDSLTQDIENMNEGKPISLLSKWLPSENTSSMSTRIKAKSLRCSLGFSAKNYRKTLSSLRKYSKVLETQISRNQWDKVDYNTVPSMSNLKYRKAFMRHDAERRLEYLSALEKGIPSAKINASTTYPYDIVHSYIGKYPTLRHFRLSPYRYDYIPGAGISGVDKDITLEEMWKNLPDYGLSDTLVVNDSSGSMTVQVGNSNVTALEVASSLAIYCSQKNSKEYRNKCITFSESPKYVNLTGETLLENLIILSMYCEIANTNIEAVFDLVLDTALRKNLANEDLPKNILIISDMEFDQAVCEDTGDTLFSTISKNYQEHGYNLPRLVFWNVNSRTATIPLIENENGVLLVSGFSPSILSMVMSGEIDPWKALLQVICGSRYSPVFEALRSINVDN